ncbi:MAG: DUF6797 domain-containing protein [Zavarzinella sp.]
MNPRHFIYSLLTTISVIAVYCYLPAEDAKQVSKSQTLEQELLAEGAASLAKAALANGDPVRGATLFYQPYLACSKCHDPQDQKLRIGPDLAKLSKPTTAEHLIESILEPSRVIHKGFEGITITLLDGSTVKGMLLETKPGELVVRDAARDFGKVTIAVKDIDTQKLDSVSLMPTGQANQLTTRQQFLDIARYLIDINTKGPSLADELRPKQISLVRAPLPAYENDLDHAGLIADLNTDSLKRGGEIYSRICMNCHGTKDKPGSMPTSLRFAEGVFKSGSDPYSMYRTLTHGFGLMPQQTLLVPRQKYDVIHYIRETFLKPANRSQYFSVNEQYLGRLPKGKGRGPAPSTILPWVAMDYGSSLNNTYEISRDKSNFAYKGIAVRLDDGPGGISRGQYWMVYDHDTMRAAAAWTGKGFIDWQGIHFDGRHQAHPHIDGQIQWTTPPGPGWANPSDGTFTDTRILGRDNKHYGPLPKQWLHYKGQYRFGNKIVLDYTVGTTKILESPRLAATMPESVFTRIFNIGPRDQEMVLRVAQSPAGATKLETNQHPKAGHLAILVPAKETQPKEPAKGKIQFNGSLYLEAAKPDDFDMTQKDFTIAARIKTNRTGVIFAKTASGEKWVPDGKGFFIRNGKLVYDIGWVGAVTSRRLVNDNRWHDVALSWEEKSGMVTMYIDGKRDSSGILKPKAVAKGQKVRIGFAAPNFPNPEPFQGAIAGIRFYQRKLSEDDFKAGFAKLPEDKALIASWNFDAASSPLVNDQSGNTHDAKVVLALDADSQPGMLVAGLSESGQGLQFRIGVDGDLQLVIPAGKDSLQFQLWLSRIEDKTAIDKLGTQVASIEASVDLAPLTKGGSPQWPGLLRTQFTKGADDNAFAIDILTLPVSNPWACQIRLSGLDFYPEGNRMVACTWDGDVWEIKGISGQGELTWQRIASGLFQPLGIKIVEGKIYVCCRDQLVILNDLDGDGETDYYENFNNDHQVTEHFHEFAMGLQTDSKGNFYYAKAARHALPAIIPHHGTLLRVDKNGSKTDILATGFRAPNGVCLNTDGTFFLTDQEGHWTPKNRINHVKVGGFYGNMFGYHHQIDPSDSAMELPLCWITNSFDRSPSELLWVPENTWGPLGGSLMNLSYGYGKVYVVPHETVNGQMQGGMSELPLPQFPTGTMRGRFNPTDKQLYLCGMNAWGSNQQQPGGFYRVRFTGKEMAVPLDLQASEKQMTIRFSSKLDAKAAADASQYQVTVWDLKRNANYGSKHINERKLEISSVDVSPDGCSITLKLPKLEPTWGMEIKYSLKTASGQSVRNSIHSSIYHLKPKK